MYVCRRSRANYCSASVQFFCKIHNKCYCIREPRGVERENYEESSGVSYLDVPPRGGRARVEFSRTRGDDVDEREEGGRSILTGGRRWSIADTVVPSRRKARHGIFRNYSRVLFPPLVAIPIPVILICNFGSWHARVIEPLQGDKFHHRQSLSSPSKPNTPVYPKLIDREI